MLLNAENIRKSFGDRPVLDGVSLTLDAGETLALTGESGSGKSTLIHLLGGLDLPDSGAIELEGRDITTLDDSASAALRRERIGVVFQQFNLIPSLSVAANLSFQAQLAGRADAEWTDILSTRLGLSDHLQKYPEELSGGQQQRVAIGRALATRPALVLADEPTGNLDESTAEVVMNLMLDLVRDSGAGLIMATHSERLAGRLDRRAHLTLGRLG